MYSLVSCAVPIKYHVTVINGCEMIVSVTAGGYFTQLVTHKLHYQAQASNTLRQHGVMSYQIDFDAFAHGE